MTAENRERAYKNFRHTEKNYVAPEGKEGSLEATDKVRAKAKKMADALLSKNPELAEMGEQKKEDENKKKALAKKEIEAKAKKPKKNAKKP